MKQFLTVLVAAMFAATSFAAVAQDKKMDKKSSAMEKKSAGKKSGMDKKAGAKKGGKKSEKK